MLEFIAVRYLHFIAIIVLMSLLVCQHVLLKPELSLEQIKRLRKFDGFYGLSALVTLLMGLLLWFAVGKPANFYSPNPIFHIKVACFVVVGLLSIIPTVFYLRAARAEADVIKVPARIILLVRIQLLQLLVIPLLAVLMAHGVGV